MKFPIEVKNSKLAKLIGYNITLYPFIFYIDAEPSQEVVDHEMVHVAQIKEFGPCIFYYVYVTEYFRNLWNGMKSKDAYRNIPYEKEAYGDDKTKHP